MFNFMHKLSDFIWTINEIAVGAFVALGIIKFVAWGYEEFKHGSN